MSDTLTPEAKREQAYAAMIEAGKVMKQMHDTFKTMLTGQSEGYYFVQEDVITEYDHILKAQDMTREETAKLIIHIPTNAYQLYSDVVLSHPLQAILKYKLNPLQDRGLLQDVVTAYLQRYNNEYSLHYKEKATDFTLQKMMEQNDAEKNHPEMSEFIQLYRQQNHEMTRAYSEFAKSAIPLLGYSFKPVPLNSSKLLLKI